MGHKIQLSLLESKAFLECLMLAHEKAKESAAEIVEIELSETMVNWQDCLNQDTFS